MWECGRDMNDAKDSVAPPKSGIMVIRVWNEADAPNGFRARLTFGTGDEQSRSAVSADVDDVVESVRAWLVTFAGSPASDPADASG
jgi:acetaldehyde dehydrogenase (acetylating)